MYNKPDQKNQPPRGELFLVATPIGNLADITLRALETLKSVDRIACEDTRTSFVLLKHYGISAPLTAYHAHNEAAATEQLLADLQRGQRIAVISDAGTPLLSDPGARLVAAAISAGIKVTPIPGPSALLAAVTMAGSQSMGATVRSLLTIHSSRPLRVGRLIQAPSRAAA